jgi:hypothetical protein
MPWICVLEEFGSIMHLADGYPGLGFSWFSSESAGLYLQAGQDRRLPNSYLIAIYNHLHVLLMFLAAALVMN